MRRVVLTLTDAVIKKLQAVVDADNATNGTTLTLDEWIILHLKEIAISADLIARVETRRREAEALAAQALEASIAAERAALIAALDNEGG